MYSQNEIDEAVAAGAISRDSAAALQAFIERHRSTSLPDEEHFRLITGFNDIFVSVAAAILLFAVGWIAQSIGAAAGLVVSDGGSDGPSFLAPLAVAATAWGLALYFTAKRRMALPSIMLVFVFVGAVFFAAALLEAHALMGMTGGEPEAAFGNDADGEDKLLLSFLGIIAFAITSVAAWLHWRKFRVPVTVAAGALAASGIIVAIVAAILSDTVSDLGDVLLWIVLALGVGVFLLAMWWDSSDRGRITRRSDVAFWLHLLAAPMIVHSVFSLLGLTSGDAGPAQAVAVILLYLVLGVTALAIDRRALLVSALAYVLWALSTLFQRFGAVELNVALTALVIGSALLLLSAFWHQARSAIVRPLPESLRDRLPIVGRSALIPQPAA